MSMHVDFATPLTDEERQYLHDRGRYADIERIDNQFGTEADPLGTGVDSRMVPLSTGEQLLGEKERLLARLQQLGVNMVEADDGADGGVDPYEVWTPEELKAEIDRRNEVRSEELKISKSGANKTLANRLYADDADAQP